MMDGVAKQKIPVQTEKSNTIIRAHYVSCKLGQTNN